MLKPLTNRIHQLRGRSEQKATNLEIALATAETPEAEKRAIQRHHQGEEGIFMLALIGALAVVAILMVTFGDNLATGFGTSNFQQAKNNLTKTRRNIQAKYQASLPDYSGLDTTTAVNVNAFPDTMTSGGGTPTNVWNGQVGVAAAANPNQFYIEENQVPKGPCNEWAVQGLGQWERVEVNGTQIQEGSAMSDASSACVDGGSTVTFYSR